MTSAARFWGLYSACSRWWVHRCRSGVDVRRARRGARFRRCFILRVLCTVSTWQLRSSRFWLDQQLTGSLFIEVLANLRPVVVPFAPRELGIAVDVLFSRVD